jgi:transposase
MSVKRRKYSPAEKAKIVLEAIKGELTMAEMVAKYAIHATQINTWKRQALSKFHELFVDNAKREQADHESQLTELYEQIGRLKVENDFLKKKFNLFTM